MKSIIIILFFGIFINLNLIADEITVKKTKNHYLTAKPIKEHFTINKEIVRAGEQSQKFVLPHGSCNKQDCKWSSQRTERELKISHKSKKKGRKSSLLCLEYIFSKRICSYLGWNKNDYRTG